MVRIDGGLTDATFRVKSEAVQHNDKGNKIFIYCVEAYSTYEYTICYIAEVLARYAKEHCNAKDTDEIFVDVTFNVNKAIGDII